MSGLGPFTAKGRISQDFGPGISAEPDGIYVERDAGGWLRGRPTAYAAGTKRNDIHLAIDIACPTGTSLLAPEAGTVLSHSYDPASGNYIILGIRPGTIFIAGHLSKFVAPVGAKVKRGQKIALSGATGKVTGPHVHASIRRTTAAKPNWRRWYSQWFSYNPERLMVGGDMAKVAWIKPKPA